MSTDHEIAAPDQALRAQPISTAHFDQTIWKPWTLLIAAVVAIFLFSFHNTLWLMIETWHRSRTFSHCFLIVPIFAYLVWIRRHKIAQIAPQPNFWAAPLLVILIFGWLLGNLAEVRVVQELAVIAILVSVVWTLLGTAVLRALAFPLFFLIFSVPFGTGLIKPLQDFTSWFVIHALTISHVPAVLENHMISLPLGVWTVAETCSGIRFLLSSVVLGMVFAVLMYQSLWRRLGFICASIVVPIIGNSLRAYGTILVAYITNNKVAVGVDHIVYGGVFSVLIEFSLMVIGLKWRQITLYQSDAPLLSQGKSEGKRKLTHRSQFRIALVLTAASSVLMLLGPVVAWYLWSRSAAASVWTAPPVTVSLPWQSALGDDTSWQPSWHSPDAEFNHSYRDETSRVDLQWRLFSGRDAIDLLAPADALRSNESWTLVSQTHGRAVLAGKTISVYQSEIQSGKISRTLWTWYWADGEWTADRTRVRLVQAKARLLGKPAEIAVISVAVDNQTNAAQTLQEFLQHVYFAAKAQSVLSQESQLAHN